MPAPRSLKCRHAVSTGQLDGRRFGQRKQRGARIRPVAFAFLASGETLTYFDCSAEQGFDFEISHRPPDAVIGRHDFAAAMPAEACRRGRSSFGE